MACHGMGPGCTVIGADDACGRRWTSWVGAAVMGSPAVGVMVASPWTVRRRCWWSVGSVQVEVGLVIEWRRMVRSPDVISSHQSVLVWTAPLLWQVLKPVAVWGGAVLWGELHCGDGVVLGLCAGAFLCGWWGWCLGHPVVRLLWGFRFLQFCADGSEDVWEGGGGGGAGCRIVPGDVVLLWVLGALL